MDEHMNMMKLWMANAVCYDLGIHSYDIILKDSKSENIHSALNIIYEIVDRLANASRFDVMDMMFSEIDVEKSSTEFIVMVLSVTLPYKIHLPRRREFFENVDKKLRSFEDFSEGLLIGLG